MSAVVYLVVGIAIGGFVAFLTLRSSLKKDGAGNCGMCKTCKYRQPPSVLEREEE